MYSENNIKILEFHNKKIEELEKKIKELERDLDYKLWRKEFYMEFNKCTSCCCDKCESKHED